MKVYVVTQGDYSDYHILGVFSNKKKAKMAAEQYSDQWDEARVEEYIVNSLQIHPQNYFTYLVVMDKQGYTHCIDRISPRDSLDYAGIWGDDCMFFEIEAKDQDHAVKIANERRTRLLIENLWTNDSYKRKELQEKIRELINEGKR